MANCRHCKLFISRLCFISFKFCLLYSKHKLIGHCEKISSITQFTPPSI